MSKTSRRVLTGIEALGVTGYIAWYIWQLQTSKPNSWMVFPIWLVLSLVLHRDTSKTLGWRADNLWPATRQGLGIPAAFIIGPSLAGIFLGAYHRPDPRLTEPWRFFAYFAFCLVTQV